MNKQLKVLIVEDSDDDTQLLLRELKKGGYKPTHKRVETAPAMKKALKGQAWDIILSDYKMPRFSAPAALKVLQSTNLDIPFIIVSGSVGEDIAVELLKEGAHDFITKMNLSRLIPAIEREMQDWKVRQAKKNAETALEESEHRYRHLFANHPNPMWIYDIVTFKFLDVNDAAIDKYGYTREEFLSMTLFDIRPKTEHKRLKENLSKPRPALQHSGEWRHLLKNGETIFVEVSSYLFEDNGKKLALVVINDITERKRTEEILRKSEKQYRDIFENDLTGDYITTTDGRILMCNPAFARIFGYDSVEELINIDTTGLYKSMEDRKRFLDILREKKKLELHEIELQRRDGKKIAIIENVIGEFNEHDELIRIKGYMFNITERKEAEEALKLQTTYFTQLFENSPTGIAFLDTNERVMNVNKAFENIFQYSLEEIKGKSLTGLIVPEELVKESLSFSTKAMQGELVRLPSIRKRRDGTRLDMIITGYPILIEGKCVGIYAIYADVSDIKKLEDQIRQAQKLESLGTLAGGIAHDFNNILGIILGYTSLLEDGVSNPAKIKLSMDAITKAVHRGAGLVKQILTFARKTNIVIEPVNANDSIQELVKMLNETFPKTISFKLNLDGKLADIIADHNQLHQAILNLSVNARDAILSNPSAGQVGTITYSTKIVPGTELRKKIPDALDENYVCISVTDSGSGMDEATLNRIFEPFFTTKEQGKGTGLGLAVVYGVVKSHRGFVDVQSELGAGTTFYLYFPLEIQIVVPENVKEEPEMQVAGGHETILFVEDEEMLQEVVKTQLTLKGYRVLSAFNGEEAVEMYRTHQVEIAAVLSDLGLPKLGGFEAFLQMKKINPNVKIILASGFFEPTQKSSMLETGVEYFVQKPYRANEILTAIRKLLDKN
ncbi:MAG: PAS domain S-box protein [Bacteroidota bacterium]|nr:PAS domain S-box protein [Bacteroidota bacterium]